MSREKAKELLVHYLADRGGDAQEIEEIVDEIVDAAVRESRVAVELRLKQIAEARGEAAPPCPDCKQPVTRCECEEEP